MTAKEIVKSRRDEIIKAAMVHGAINLRLFGSLAHGQSTAESDIDLLVDISPDTSLLDLIAAKRELEKLTGCKVDLVTADSISPHIRDSVLKNSLPL
ncbi:MAG: nucleotidyltransferase family protein [Candidatus Glassbacteria bacterium]|nr:nucleotidyltransferase family protein [Candidatus Glassbacteria bacterium]